MNLIKYAVLAGAAWYLYRLFENESRNPFSRPPRLKEVFRPENADYQPITGRTGEGQRAIAQDTDGGTISHRVGRGVVR